VTFEPPLEHVVLLRRYQRFLADVRRADGTVITVHVANSGSMRSCLGEEWPACISDSGNPARRCRHTLEMVRGPDGWIGVNTHVPNGLALQAIRDSIIPGFAGWGDWRREVAYGSGSRIDLLGARDGRLCYVEVKNVTLLDGDAVSFPDSVTSRGLKHLHDLMDEVAKGQRAVLLLVVQRAGGSVFRPADAIDAAWGQGLRQARAAGVELIAWRFRVAPEGIEAAGEVPIEV
jgi:sugar fermentation stimulation protein A